MFHLWKTDFLKASMKNRLFLAKNLFLVFYTAVQI